MNEPYLEEMVAGETLCPRCGSEAEWRYRDSARVTVEISCASCGAFDLARVDFAVIEAGILNPE